jgi:hypothetical protein
MVILDSRLPRESVAAHFDSQPVPYCQLKQCKLNEGAEILVEQRCPGREYPSAFSEDHLEQWLE